ncbi:hypothetical protein FHS83_003511 [Rhizomicrobium palustre]|uniref:Uncharacterized protein n=1 Tax=Rhizomicrobium palustre TaxID=189966 RepID=A0A846N3L3_9PROT|nr:hypothetical protein [Rhizomicrobium palustre]NIK90193.1 hypothetical protein [Rhizomicrobium palustre]
MTKDDLHAWALAHGWQEAGGFLSLMKPRTFDTAIVRLVLKATVAALEIKKPNGKWEKVSGAAYSAINAGEEGDVPSGLGLDTINGLSSLMQQNKDHLVFAKMR